MNGQEGAEYFGPEEPAAPADQDAAVDAGADVAESTGEGEGEAEPDRPGLAWESRRDLLRHSPAFGFGSEAQIAGSVVGGDQTGVAGGTVGGDVLFGSTVNHIYSGAPDSEGRTTALLVAEEVAAATEGFVPPLPDAQLDAGQPLFERALEQLHFERIVVLTGRSGTGRRTAALALLQAAGADKVQELDAGTPPGRLPEQLHGTRWHLLCEPTSGPDRPFRSLHLRAAAQQLRAADGYLVVVTGPRPALESSVQRVRWHPPRPEDLLRNRLHTAGFTAEQVAQALALEPAREILAHGHPVRTLAEFATRLAAHLRGETGADQLVDFGARTADARARELLEAPDHDLHQKAFFLSLAAFDDAAHALAAEFADILFRHLLRTETPGEPATISVFGSGVEPRLDAARAELYEEAEATEWGPVMQTKVHFRDPRTAPVLLREAWMAHPSARGAMIGWLRRMADDPRPLVQTRAASSAAVLATCDLPSAMARLVQPWARGRTWRIRATAATALALAHRMGAPHIPQILLRWCTDPQDFRLRWVAVRCYALVGETFPHKAREALLAAARALHARGSLARSWAEEPDELAQSAAVLVLAEDPAAEEAQEQTAPARAVQTGEAGGLLADLASQLGDPAVRSLSLGTLLHACGPTEHPDGTGRPLLLDRYARAQTCPGTAGALFRQSLAALWRAALEDPSSHEDALAALHNWTRTAAGPGSEADPGCGEALAMLLAALATSRSDRRRLDYLLTTAEREFGVTPALARLRTALG